MKKIPTAVLFFIDSRNWSPSYLRTLLRTYVVSKVIHYSAYIAASTQPNIYDMMIFY